MRLIVCWCTILLNLPKSRNFCFLLYSTLMEGYTHAAKVKDRTIFQAVTVSMYIHHNLLELAIECYNSGNPLVLTAVGWKKVSYSVGYLYFRVWNACKNAVHCVGNGKWAMFGGYPQLRGGVPLSVGVLQVTTSKMPTPMPPGVSNVSRSIQHMIHHHYRFLLVVKMDWCNTDINGTKLDPKVQYPEMVRDSIQLHNYSILPQELASVYIYLPIDHTTKWAII